MPASLQREIPFKVSGGRIGNYKEAAAQTFKFGEAVAFDASGNIIALLALSGTHLNSTGTKLLGFALRDATGSAMTREEMPVWIATTDAIIRLPIYNATASLTNPPDIIAYGTPFALLNQTTIPCANVPTTANGTLLYFQKDKDWQDTDTYISCQFRFDPASLVFKS